MSKWHLLIICFLLTLVIFRILFSFDKRNNLDDFVTIVAVLDNQPRISDSRQTFKIDKFIVITKLYPELNYGDKIQIQGKAENGIVKFPKVSVLVESHSANPLKLAIFRFRNTSFDIFSKYLPEPEASTLAGIVLGIDRIPSDFVRTLRNSGLIHLVVVSGQNITLLAGFVISLARLIGRRLAIVLSLVAVFIYTLLAGAEPPVVRAGLMASLAYLSQFLGRQSFGLLLLAWSALIMLIVSPNLLFSLSFQLSFAATLGILAIYPVLRSLFRLPRFFSESFEIPLSAWIMTVPILLSAFGQFSVIAVLANFLVSFVVLPIMILGFLVLLIGLILPFLVQIIAWLVYPLLHYLVVVANILGGLPFASVDLGKVPLLGVIGYYLIIFGLLTWMLRKKLLNSN